MTEIIKITLHFLIGFIVSFVGSAPPGSINLTVIQISINRGLKQAILFSLGATAMELVFCKIALFFSSYINSHKSIEIYITLFSIPVFLILAYFSFIAAKKTPSNSENDSNPHYGNAFTKGLLLGTLNPLNIPFWVLWGTVLMNKNWIIDEPFYINVFVAGILLGTLGFLVVLALISNRIQHRFKFSSNYINLVIAYVFAGLAVLNLIDLGIKLFEN